MYRVTKHIQQIHIQIMNSSIQTMIYNKAVELHGESFLQSLKEVFSAIEHDANNVATPVVIQMDIPRPKRAMTAYLAYSKKHRAEVKESFPELKSTEIVKKLATMWKDVSTEERKIYKDMVAEDKKRYDTEMTEWKLRKQTIADNCPITQHKKRHDKSLQMLKSLGKRRKLIKKCKKTRDPSRPKRAMNSYNAFSKVKRLSLKETHPNIKTTEVMGVLAKLWKNTSEEERASFVKMANDDKVRYETEMAAWRSRQAN